MKRKYLVLLLSIFLISCGGNNKSLSSSSSFSSSDSSTSVDTGERVVELTKDKVNDFITSETSSFSTFISDDYFDQKLFVFNNVKESEGNINIVKNGFIKNSTPLYNLYSVVIEYSGILSCSAGNAVSGIFKFQIDSGIPYFFTDSFNFIELVAGDCGATVSSIVLSYKNIGSISKKEVRVFKSDKLNYTSYEYSVGETVDPESWTIPEYIFEGKSVPFKSWMNETMSEEVSESFEMPNKSLAFYPSYSMPRLYMWSYDPNLIQYESTGYGVREIEGLSGQFGCFKIDVFITNTTTTGVGPIFNAKLNDKDYPKDYTDGNEYFYFHLNPTNGGFQFSIVKDKYDAKKSIALTSTPQAWQDKWNAWNNSGKTGVLALQMEIKAEYLATTISVDGDAVYVYQGQTGLNGTAMGMRTNAAGNIVKNWSFEEYKYSYSSKNGYLIDTSTGTYTTLTANATIALPDFSSRHGRFEADVTWENKTSSNARTGIFFNHGIKYDDSPVLVNDATNYGYYMHHNPYGNANFTATMYSKGTYGKTPDKTSGGLKVVNYNTSTEGVLGSYYARNRAFFTGEGKTLTVRYQIEVTSTYIAIGIDGTEIGRCTTSSLLNIFDSYKDCIHPGFTSSVSGTVFSNLTFEVFK